MQSNLIIMGISISGFARYFITWNHRRKPQVRPAWCVYMCVCDNTERITLKSKQSLLVVLLKDKVVLLLFSTPS